KKCRPILPENTRCDEEKSMCGGRTPGFWGALPAIAMLALACAPQIALTQNSAAADFPNRTIRIIVGFTPGGAPDITGRVIAQGLQELWKQSVVVENRAGAGSAIAAQYVASSTPDGYTLMSITAAHAVAPAIH